MFVHEAPFLGAVNGAAKLRHEAVRLQCYADVNPGSQPDVLAFWEAQKALADVDHGLPYDGTWVPGALDLRPSCYKVLSHYRMFNTAGLADYKAFCDFFILANGGVIVPLSFSKNLSGSNASDADATYVAVGSAYNNSVEVTGGKAPYTYQWFKRSGGADGAVGTDAPTYNIPAYAAGNNGDYFVRVTDAKGTVIESTRDRTRVAVSLSTNLAATAAVAHAGTISLSVVAANGLAPYTYQWFKDDVAIEGRTSASFSKANATTADSGRYHVVVTSSNTRAPKTVKSVVCAVTVAAPVEPESVTVEPTTVSVEVGAASAAPVVTVLPANAADKTGTWAIDDPAVATIVAGTGVVTGVTAGTATATFTTNTGAKTATIAVTVTAPPPVEPEVPAE